MSVTGHSNSSEYAWFCWRLTDGGHWGVLDEGE
jgi:hypothetical protein